jgi:hypothetical protein
MILRMSGLCFGTQQEDKAGSLSDFTGDANITAMQFEDAAHDG